MPSITTGSAKYGRSSSSCRVGPIGPIGRRKRGYILMTDQSEPRALSLWRVSQPRFIRSVFLRALGRDVYVTPSLSPARSSSGSCATLL
eukprot:1184982-Prorocentrum_minimum.AAC.2